MSRIEIIKFKYDVGDLIEFKIYDGNASTIEVVVGVIIKRDIQNYFWYEEAEKQVWTSGMDILVYEVVHEGTAYTIKEKEILKLVSTKLN